MQSFAVAFRRGASHAMCLLERYGVGDKVESLLLLLFSIHLSLCDVVISLLMLIGKRERERGANDGNEQCLFIDDKQGYIYKVRGTR